MKPARVPDPVSGADAMRFLTPVILIRTAYGEP